MRMPALIVGLLLVIAGGLIAAGVFKYQDTDKVVDLGRLEVEATHEKKMPINWGYVLIGGGIVLLVVGAAAKAR